jgi:hypothetical protein
LIEQKAALERLRPSEKADHKTVLEEQGLKREVCTDGTRVKILEDITKWANDRSLASPRVFWLTGQAGSGKTTIAYTIAKRFEEVVMPTSTPSWVATFSARDNSKKRKPRPVSFPPLPTNLLINANRMQTPCMLPTNSTQSITTSPAR